MREHSCIDIGDQRSNARLSHRGEGSFDVVRAPHRVGRNVQAEARRQGLHLCQIGGTAVLRVPYEPNERCLRHGLSDELEPLAAEGGTGSERSSSDVRTRSRQTLNEAGSNGVTRDADDGHSCGFALGGRCDSCSCRDENIHFEVYEFGDEPGQPVELSIRVSILDHDRFVLQVAELAQPLLQSLNRARVGSGRAPEQNANTIYLPRPLRLGGERHRESCQ